MKKMTSPSPLASILASILVLSSLSQASTVASVSSLNKTSEQARTATILVNESTSEACVVRDNSKISTLNACNTEEQNLAAELNRLPQNPQVAVAGSIAQTILGYYMLCSIVQGSTDIFDAIVKDTDKRTTFEKVKDLINPSEEVKVQRSFRNDLSDFSEQVMATVCLPVGVANKKLITIYNSN